MKKTSLTGAVFAVLAALMMSLPAQAHNYWNKDMPSGWSKSGAGGDNGVMLAIDAGYPDLKLNFLKSGAGADFGAFFNFTYQMFDWGDLGLQLGANMRFGLSRGEKWDLSLQVNPGLEVYFYDAGYREPKLFGLLVDIRLLAGIQIVPRFRVHAGIAIPFELIFAGTDNFGDIAPWVSLPILANGGVEFKITPKISVNADLRLGPGFKFGDGVDWNDLDPWDYEDGDEDMGAWFDYRITVGVAFFF